MIGKLREISETKERIDQVHQDLEIVKQDVYELSELVKSTKKESGELKELMEEVKNDIRIQMNELSDTVSGKLRELEGELSQLRLMSSSMQNKVLDKLDSETTELAANLSARTKNYVDAESELKSVVLSIKALKGEVDKLAEIGSKIKKEDFQLPRFRELLKKEEKEKMELNKQIDSLQRLVSAERRRDFNRKRS